MTLSLLLAAAAAHGAPDPGEIRQKASSGDHSGALRLIAQSLALRGEAAEGVNRYELLMIKGECLVQINSLHYAAEAFEDAREEIDEPEKAATAWANELIIRRSPMLKYVPRSGANRNPIEIKSPESRKKAMLAMRADLLASNKSRVELAAKAENLEPMLPLLPALREMALLEYGATGDLKETRPLMKTLGTHARELIVRELRVCRGEVAQRNAAAAEIVVVDDVVSRRGFYSNERKDLAAMGEYLHQIEEVTREGLRLARLLGGDAPAWERLVADAAAQAIRVSTILRRID